jgi:two-component system, cell cycle response regulator CpdR
MAHILLADDDVASRELVRRALEIDGHKVHVVGDGGEGIAALDAATAPPFDLIVTDVEMPGTDGIALAKHALAASGTIKVLMISGFNEALDRGRWLGPARLGVLAKPFTLEQIRRSIKTVLEA